MKAKLMSLLASCGVDARFSELERIARELIDDGVTIPVRCKGCKFWDEQNKELYTYDSKPENKDNLVDFAECLYWSNWSTCHSTRFNDFCSLGERRNDGKQT